MDKIKITFDNQTPIWKDKDQSRKVWILKKTFVNIKVYEYKKKYIFQKYLSFKNNLNPLLCVYSDEYGRLNGWKI